MRPIATIATIILVISLAVPAGLLLAGTTSTTQSVEPKTSGPNLPEARRNMIAVPPENVPIKPPEKEIGILSPKLPEPQIPPGVLAQPAQLPVREPPDQIQQQALVIEVGPSGYIFKGAMVSLWRAEGDHAKDLVRAQLSDADLAPFSQVRGLHGDANRTMSLAQAFEEIDARMTDWLARCPPRNRGLVCPEEPVLYLRLTEADLVPLVGLVNSNTVRQHSEGGIIEKSYDSVVTYNGVRYLVRILTHWAPRG